jgi:hypothetical protein
MTTLFDAIVRKNDEQVYAIIKTPNLGEVEIGFNQTHAKPATGGYFGTSAVEHSITLMVHTNPQAMWEMPIMHIGRGTTREDIVERLEATYELYGGCLVERGTKPHTTPSIQALLAEPDAGRP